MLFWGMCYIPDRISQVGLVDHENEATSPNAILIGSVSDDIVLYYQSRGQIVGFPQGWVRHIGHHKAERGIIVGECTIKIVHGSDSRVNSSELFNVCNGGRLSV